MEKIYTLSRGGRARLFGYTENEREVKILTGRNFESEYNISNEEIAKLLVYFQDKEWFILGNQVDNIKKGGLGDYFKTVLKASPKYASHVAAYLVKNGTLLFRDEHGFSEFKIR